MDTALNQFFVNNISSTIKKWVGTSGTLNVSTLYMYLTTLEFELFVNDNTSSIPHKPPC